MPQDIRALPFKFPLKPCIGTTLVLTTSRACPYKNIVAAETKLEVEEQGQVLANLGLIQDDIFIFPE